MMVEIVHHSSASTIWNELMVCCFWSTWASYCLTSVPWYPITDRTSTTTGPLPQLACTTHAKLEHKVVGKFQVAGVGSYYSTSGLRSTIQARRHLEIRDCGVVHTTVWRDRTASCPVFNSRMDELSLIVLIENEITRDHRIQTKEDAIALWKRVRSSCSSLLKPWLDRNCTATAATAVNVTRDMLVEAASYEVMFAKMLRTIPQSELEQILNQVEEDYTFHYHAIQSDSNGADPSWMETQFMW